MNETGETTPARQKVLRTASLRAREVKQTVSQEAGRALDNIKSATRDQLERQRMELADSLSEVKKALRNTSTRVDNPTLTPGIERVADAVESAQQFLDSHEVDDVGIALRRLSIRNPIMFYSGLFALGFAAGRFLTSSEQDTFDEPKLEIDLLQASSRSEENFLETAVPYHGPY